MTKKGLVAFLDIMGYQDIINNNLIEEVAKIISDILLNVPTDAKKKMADAFKDANPAVKELVTTLLSKIEYRVISDSILLVLEMPKKGKKLKKTLWLFFLVYVGELLNHSFSRGLPLRGAVDYGDFFLDSNCFAGKPIINCYRLGNSLEISGCVLTSDCGEAVESLFQDIPSDKVLCEALISYLVPFKDGNEKRLWSIQWLDVKPIKDIRQYIIKAFQAHNKDIARDVYSKIDNTEVMLRCFLERAPGLSKVKK